MSVVNWSGDIAANTTMSGSDIHRITGALRVLPGVTLTIEPGAQIKSNGGILADILVEGSLIADGTQAQPIIFTSIFDDTGADGVLGTGDDDDTNANGASQGHKGAWDSIQFASGSTGLLDHVEVRFGGQNTEGSVTVSGQSTQLAITNSTIRHSLRNGLLITNSNPTLTTVTFSNNSNDAFRSAARMDALSSPDISGVTLINNSVNAMRVDGGTITGSATWGGNMPYAPSGSITVAAGATLTVEPGTVTKFDNNVVKLIVEGTLLADGTVAQPIVFTSLNDDTGLDGVLGNADDIDSNNNGSTDGTKGFWDSIQFQNGGDGTLDHVHVRFGAQSAEASVVINGASSQVTITDSIIRHALRAGLQINNANPTLTNITFSNNSADSNHAAARMTPGSTPQISGITMVNNGVNAMRVDGGTVTGNATWGGPMPFAPSGSVTIAAGATLTLNPGTVVKSANNVVQLLVEGTLLADGTDALPIVFTAFNDDTGLDGILGNADDIDSNNNGSGNGTKGFWDSLQFLNGGVGTLDHVEVRFGGQSTAGSVVVSGQTTQLTMTDSIIRHSLQAGLMITNSNPVLTDITFSNNSNDNTHAAARMDALSRPTFDGVTMTNNAINAINISGGSLTANMTWDNPEIVYRMLGDVTVPVGITLTIGAGQIIKSTPNEATVIVNGTLISDGTAAAPVIFTTDRDDSAGGDTTNDGAGVPFGGESGGLRFNPGSTGTIDFTEVRYAGDAFNANNASASILINDADVTITNSLVLGSHFRGIRVQNANPTIAGTEFRDNVNSAAISIDLASSPTITSPTLSNNAINAVAVDGFASLTQSVTWNSPHIPYRIAGPTTVPAGMTLTIGAGQVVKAAPGVSSELFIDGTLIADGTPDAPIIFTTDRDDSAGGDTNNNGPSNGQFFDWQALRFRAGSTNNLLDHVDIRFAGANVPGAVTVIESPLTMTNSIVRGSATHAVAVQTNSVVTLQSNLLIQSSGNAINVSNGGSVTAVNNTIDGNARGVNVQVASFATLRNNLITNNTVAGVAAENLATVTASFNDVFNPGVSNYSNLADQTGQNGNISADPLYFNRANRQFTLLNGSPAVDSASSDFAPTTDAKGNPRFDDPNNNNTGGGASPFFDRGAFERQEISFSDIDLATTSVTGPTSASLGDSVTVNWTVANLGAATATGSWSDAIYVSQDLFFSPDDKLLKRVTHTGDLGAGQSYDDSTSVTLDGVSAGKNYFIVRTNDLNQVFEGVATANNAGVSQSSIDFAVTAATLGAPANSFFSGIGQSLLFQVVVPAGQTLSVVLDSLAGSGATELYVRRNAVPSRSVFDFHSNALAPDQSITVPSTGPGTYYILAYAASGAAAASAFTLTASLAGFNATSISPATGSNSGRVTIAVQGTGFTFGADVSLIAPDATVIPAVATQFADATLVYATFDLAGRTPGLYDVSVSDGVTTDTLADAFNVTAGAAGKLEARIIAPDRVRAGFAGSITIEYTNVGDADLVAPIMMLQVERGKLKLPGELSFSDSVLEFLAINDTGPAGVLPPGASASFKVAFLPETDEPLNFILAEAQPDVMYDWASQKTSLRPTGVPTDAWDAIFANFLLSVGDTSGDYRDALAADATYLSQLGEYVGDMTRLFNFELARAGNFGEIAQRYTLGAFGRGVPDVIDIDAVADAAGNVTIHSAGRERHFVRQINGSYLAAPGDAATLSLASGTYRLREADGTLLVFLPSGAVNYTEDASGNRITYSYSSGRVSALTDALGNQTTFSYNGSGLITQMTDLFGQVTSFTYDAARRVTSVTDPSGVTQFSYVTGQGAAREHATASITFPDGTAQLFEYDTRGRLTRSIRSGAEEVVVTYAAPGGVTSTTSAGTTTVLSNDYGQPGIIIDNTGQTTRLYYDADRQLVRAEGPGGVTGELSYDQNGNVIESVNGLGDALQMTYELGHNRLLNLRDPRGRLTQFTYDADGNPTAITHADGSTQQFELDANGRITAVTDRLGRVMQFTYDADGQVTSLSLSDGTSRSFAYDNDGNLTSATDASGVTAMERDAANHLTKITYPGGRSLSFTYDAAGRRSSSTDQSGFKVNYSYDSVGRLSELTNLSGDRIVKYSYDALSRIVREERGNGTKTEYTYVGERLLESIVHRGVDDSIQASFEYVYDNAGRVASIETLDGLTTYGYDAAGRLASIALPGGRVITYVYDASGNRVSATDTGITTNYTANGLNQYTSVGATSYSYDAAGNLISATNAGGTTSYTYDAEDRLVAIDSPTETITYEYGVLGHLRAATRNGVLTEYLVDPLNLGDVVAEYDAGGALVAHYTHGFGLASRVDDGGASAYYTYDGGGNTSQVLSAAGQVVNSYAYLPHGQMLSETGSAPNPFTFAGRYGVMEATNDLYFMRERFYDASLGRFLAPDPVGLSGGDINLYTYAANNPISGVDPSGLAFAPTLAILADAVKKGATIAINKLGFHSLFTNAPIGRFVNLMADHNGAGFAAASLIFVIGRDVAGMLPDKDLKHQVIAGAGVATVGWSLINMVTAYELLFGVTAASAALVTAGGTLIVAGGVSIATAGSYITGRWLDRNVPIVNKVASRTAGAIVDTFFAPDRVKLGDRAKIIQRLCGDLLVEQADECHRRLDEAGVGLVKPVDPNDIAGPAGYGEEHFITGEEPMPYIILFENKPDAAAAAVLVTITHQLDSDLDLTTFELGDFGFGDLRVEVPAGLRFYSTRIDYTAVNGEYVDFVASLDMNTGVATWTLTSIDPATGEMATDVDAGFLPPDINRPDGEGFVLFTVHAKPGLVSGTTIDAQASIVFDANAPLLTPVFTNTIDTTPPTSGVTALPATTQSVNFIVDWSGDDGAGSDIAFYDIYVSDDGGPFTLFKSQTTDTSATFFGEDEHTYSFYSVATDNVGNVQPTPGAAQATTMVDAFTRTLGAGGAKSIKYTDADGTLVTVTLSIGAAELQFNGDNLAFTSATTGDTITGTNIVLASVALAGTTNKSALTFTTNGGNGFADVGAITGSTALSAINAATIDLVGAGINMTGDATVITLKLHDIESGADVIIAGESLTAGTTMTANRLSAGTDMTLGSGIKKLTLNDWSGGTLTAPWVASLTTAPNKDKTVPGDFLANLSLCGCGTTPPNVLGTVKIAGALGSGDADDPITWDIGGNATSITAGNVSGLLLNVDGNLTTLKLGRVTDADVDAEGDVGTITAIEWLAGEIEADSIKTLTISGAKTPAIVAGDMNASLTLAGSANPAITTALTTAKVTGGLGASPWSIAGRVGSITGGAVTGWSLANATALKTLTLGRVADADVTVNGDIGTLKAVEWLAGSIVADSIKSLSTTGNTAAAIAGDWLAAIGLDGSVVATVTQVLGTAKIAGQINSVWDLAGDPVGTITAGSTGSAFDLYAPLVSITSITVNTDLAGAIAALRIGTLTVKDDLTGATVTLNQAVDPKINALTTLTVAGEMLNSAVRAAGNISAANIGAMRQSTLFAGVDPAVTQLPAIAADLVAQATIKTVNIKGITGDVDPKFAGSRIAAATLGTMNLLTIDATNDGTPFGLAGQMFTLITFTDAGVKRSAKNALELAALGLPMGDFNVRVPL